MTEEELAALDETGRAFMQQGQHSSLIATGGALRDLIAEMRRLRAALAQYADGSNWIASGEDGCSDDDQDRWHGDGEGFDLARAALGHKVK